MKYENIPHELRCLPQWALAGADKAPLTVDKEGGLYRTSVSRPSEWLNFERAKQLIEIHKDRLSTHTRNDGAVVEKIGLDLGFILNAADPFTCVDLDVKDAESHPNNPDIWTTAERFALYDAIISNLNSYTERSRSGKGHHIWCLGNIGPGFHRDGIEVYSRDRFMICTGNVVRDLPVEDRQTMLTNMVAQMRPMPKTSQLVEVEETEDDWYVLDKAVKAGNSAKFMALWCGKWQEMGFPSQSEADLALMSMFAFYSPSNAQCRRLFRDSALGKRDKAVRDDKHLNYDLTTIRSRQAREQQVEMTAILQSAEMVAKAVVPPLPPELEQAEPVALNDPAMPWPPGTLGEIARYIYGAAPRPVREVAIVAALGLMAGLAGKAWHIPQSGLNLYVILVARSAVGKESMHSGIAAIIRECSRENPLFGKYVDFSEFVSAPALTKACAANPSFVNVSGEWGRRLKRLSVEDGRDQALQGLRTQMTNLYQKSGPQSIVGGLGYSNKDSNVASVAGVAYSMIGETTPGTFYEALTPSMMEDGFLSRFVIIEYEGDRPEPNGDLNSQLPENLRLTLNNIAMQADFLIASNNSNLVNRTIDAANKMAAFEKECDININGTQDESRRQTWNRASLKSMRMAALMAVADNWSDPTVTGEHVTWAQMVVRRDILNMQRKLDSGDVGVGDLSREKKIVQVMADYLRGPVAASYKIPDSMRESGIVPRSYLQIRVSRASSFTNYRHGVSRALDDALTMLVSNGYVIEIGKDKLVEAHGYHGKAYRIVNLPDFTTLT